MYTRFYRTYEGLKHMEVEAIEGEAYGFYRTYEGLKPYICAVSARISNSFYRTYEGLKPIQTHGRRLKNTVFIVPMRD